jgi:hypothetical protein
MQNVCIEINAYMKNIKILKINFLKFHQMLSLRHAQNLEIYRFKSST